MIDSRVNYRLSPGDTPKGVLTMGSPLQNAHGRLAVGAVVGAMAAALFAVGLFDGDPHRSTGEDRAAVEPVPPGQRAQPVDVPVTTTSSRTSTSRSTTTTTTATTTTTTTQPAPVTTTTTEPPPVTTTTNRPPPPTSTRCTSLICVG